MIRRSAATILIVLAAALVPTPGRAATVVCSSAPGARSHCPADTSAGVALVRSTGEGACLLGKTWGYDDKGIWVSDGCGGEFVVGQTAAEHTPAEPPKKNKARPASQIESWGEFEPGNGFLVGRSDAGELAISIYALLRYVNQLPADQTFTDHLGNEHPVDTRQDIFPTES